MLWPKTWGITVKTVSKLSAVNRCLVGFAKHVALIRLLHLAPWTKLPSKRGWFCFPWASGITISSLLSCSHLITQSFQDGLAACLISTAEDAAPWPFKVVPRIRKKLWQSCSIWQIIWRHSELPIIQARVHSSEDLMMLTSSWTFRIYGSDIFWVRANVCRSSWVGFFFAECNGPESSALCKDVLPCL